MTTYFNILDGNTEILVARLEGQAADTAMGKLLSLYTSEQIAGKLERCEWDLVETDTFISLTVYI